MIQVILLAVIAAIFWGTAPVFDKAALRTATPITGVVIRSIVIALAMLSLLLVSGARAEIAAVSKRELAYFAIGGLMAGFAGQLIYFYALKFGHASIVVPVIAGLYPLVAAIWGIVIFREPVTAAKLVGAALIISGVIVIRLR